MSEDAEYSVAMNSTNTMSTTTNKRYVFTPPVGEPQFVPNKEEYMKYLSNLITDREHQLVTDCRLGMRLFENYFEEQFEYLEYLKETHAYFLAH